MSQNRCPKCGTFCAKGKARCWNCHEHWQMEDDYQAEHALRERAEANFDAQTTELARLTDHKSRLICWLSWTGVAFVVSLIAAVIGWAR